MRYSNPSVKPILMNYTASLSELHDTEHDVTRILKADKAIKVNRLWK